MSSNNRGKVIRGDARAVVYKVIQYFEEEKKSKKYLPKSHSNLRAALATGLSHSTISKIRKEGKLAERSQTEIKTPSKGNRGRNNTRAPIDIVILCKIREVIASLYDIHQLPTTAKIRERVYQEINVKLSQTTLRRTLKHKLGFRFVQCSQNRKALLESDNIKAWRVKYLRQIKNNDALKGNKWLVIYLGETFIHVPCQKRIKGKKNILKKCFIIHAGSEEGFLKGAEYFYTSDRQEIASSDYLNYVKDVLIPNLPENCIIVIDNSSCHNFELNNAPTSVDSKDSIKKWMVDNYIPFEEEWTKVEMILHIQKNLPKKTYALDELLSKNGHEVIRLPPYNYDLNPIERIWVIVKDKLNKLSTDLDINNVEEFVMKAINSVTVQEWKEQLNIVKTTEKKYWLREVLREDEFEQFFMTLGTNGDVDFLSENSSSDESMQEIEYLDESFDESCF
ncbi:uncharacterized protein LOC142984840 [Anticarsia gemmatalis]|uniref:uncharacterized protein LOC142984840 n=1 Tax=Anticarsia gemmatalis TaxID=129554 RepID=UPI003F767DEC